MRTWCGVYVALEAGDICQYWLSCIYDGSGALTGQLPGEVAYNKQLECVTNMQLKTPLNERLIISIRLEKHKRTIRELIKLITCVDN